MINSVTIKQENLYTLTIGDREVKGFEKGEEWEGMVKFSGPEGIVIVNADDNRNPFSFSFLDRLTGDDSEPTEMNIVKMSTNLIPKPKVNLNVT